VPLIFASFLTAQMAVLLFIVKLIIADIVESGMKSK
jgi:hypothetical protein